MKKFVIALAIIATTSTAYAGPRHSRMFGEKLGLTDAQKQQIRDIRQAEREKNQQLYADFREKRQQLRQLQRDGDPRAAQLRTELEAMRPQIQAARKAMFERIAPILTPEQRQQIKEWRAHRRNRG